jgi:hypothetical protein
MRWATPLETLAGSSTTKLMPAPLFVVVTGREVTREKLAPASVLLNRPLVRVPT